MILKEYLYHIVSVSPIYMYYESATLALRNKGLLGYVLCMRSVYICKHSQISH